LLSNPKIKTKFRLFSSSKTLLSQSRLLCSRHLFLFKFYQSSSKCRYCRFCLTSSLIRNFVVTNFRKLKILAFRRSPGLHVFHCSVKSTVLNKESKQKIQ